LVVISFDKHATLRRESKNWLGRTQDNVPKGGIWLPADWFQWASTMKI